MSVSLSGCQVLLNVDREQCETDNDCVGLLGRDYECGPEHVCVELAVNTPEQDSGPMINLPENWQCILPENRYNITRVQGRTVEVRYIVADFNSQQVPANLIAKVCNPTDFECDNPVAEGVMPDGEGYISYRVPHAFIGRTILTAGDPAATDPDEQYLPSIVYTNRPVTDDYEPVGPAMVKRRAVEQIAMGGNTAVDIDMTGLAILTVYDCNGEAPEGVRFENDQEPPSDPAFYFESTLPNRSRTTTVTTRDLTPSRREVAAGGFTNLLPEYVAMSAIHDESGLLIGSVTVQIEAGTMTYAEIHAGY